MPRAHLDYDPLELQYSNARNFYYCLVCPRNRTGGLIELKPSAVEKHQSTLKHKRALQQTRTAAPTTPGSTATSTSTSTVYPTSTSIPMSSIAITIPSISKSISGLPETHGITPASAVTVIPASETEVETEPTEPLMTRLATDDDLGSFIEALNDMVQQDPLLDSPQDTQVWAEDTIDMRTQTLDFAADEYYKELLETLGRKHDSRRARDDSSNETTNVPLQEPDIVPVQEPDIIHVMASDLDVEQDESYPWPSMALFMTHILFSSPRVRFSDVQKTAVLEWARSMGAQDVPSLYAVKTCQSRVLKLMDDPTEKVVSKSGTIFYINNVASAIAKDYANPLTRSSMEDYPIHASGTMSQVQHGSKMLLDLPTELGPPTVRVDGVLYFINELLQLDDKELFIPERFFRIQPSKTGYIRDGMKPGELHALGWTVKRTGSGLHVPSLLKERVIVPISKFYRNYEELSMSMALSFSEGSAVWQARMPHPLRAKAKNRMVYSVPIMVFMDDVSGNITKQWNKHHVVYMSNAGMPREMVDKEFCVRFVSSSPHATPLELMDALKSSIRKTAENGVIAWDCVHQEEVMLLPYPLLFAGDNPMQAEECSHGGAKCNKYCRTCHAGGSTAYNSTEEGYANLFKPGVPREPASTVENVLAQFDVAVQYGAHSKLKNNLTETGYSDATTRGILESLASLGQKLRATDEVTKKRLHNEAFVQAELQRHLADWLKGDSLLDRINPLLGIPGLNIHKDTPTEILHTILLGSVKYYWAQTTTILVKNNHLETFQTRLASVNISGLKDSDLRADYLIQYRGSLIGKQFKSLAQVMPFLIYDLVDTHLLNAWSTLGRLVVLLWHTTIENTEEYLADLSRTIEDFLHLSAQCAPSLILSSPKLHFLVHLPGYIRRFGPALLYSTERYESFNHVFRLSNVYSNRQAPSRDSCRLFAAQDAIKHIATGGFWLDPIIKKWRCASPLITEFLDAHPVFLHLLGLETRKHQPPGYASVSRDTQKTALTWEETQSSKASHILDETGSFFRAESCIAGNGDKAHPADVVIYYKDKKEKDNVSVGRIIEILSPCDNPGSAQYVALAAMTFDQELQPDLQLPSLRLDGNQTVLPPESILAVVNVQHDCISAQCHSVEQVPRYMEREVSGQMKSLIKHNHLSDDRYLLNRYALHNHHLITQVTPPEFRKHQSFTKDPIAVRKEVVRLLQEDIEGKKIKRAAAKLVREEAKRMKDAGADPEDAMNEAKGKGKAKVQAKKTKTKAKAKTTRKSKTSSTIAAGSDSSDVEMETNEMDGEGQEDASW